MVKQDYNSYIQKELENESIRSYRIIYNLPSNSRHISPKLRVSAFYPT
ncbi:hypothetical protein BAE44_0005083 [Dichanthelium oligosanthes]|uniref:Uncharacterized protein n=1 Tax=Dichanthelium oligosanthes TaxID=888268 RepID=A0A1E5W8Z9_9POAL|nr:hypothetical protein BAE44_0005083 [Dichanthelium oligosanthes]